MNNRINHKHGYSEVNGIKMYYESYGYGNVLVLIHGGGSTIQSTFGEIIPLLTENYMVIAVELQNHGRTGFREERETFEQDADDIATLLKNIKIDKASFFGFSNGGSTALQIGSRHPEIVNKLIIAAGAYKRDGFMPGFFDDMEHATLEDMPQELKEAFLKVNPDTARLRIMFDRDHDRMLAFQDWNDEQLKSIQAPTLIINGDKDVVLPEHAIKMFRLLPNARLVIVPGRHGEYIGEITASVKEIQRLKPVVQLIKDFLDNAY